MAQYVIRGGRPISGTIRVGGNKNAALPCIAAAIMSEGVCVLRNIPDIEDVRVMLAVFRTLGGTAEPAGTDKSVWKLAMPNVKTSGIPRDAAAKIRASILFAGPILARVGEAELPPPGGDVIGRRRLDTHFLALTELGAEVDINGVFRFCAKRLRGTEIFLDETSVTATENAVMAASLAEGKTVLFNAASEPHVQDLCRMLVQMGARIEGIGSNVLTIHGVERLGGCDYTIGADFMETGSFIGLAASTHGRLTIEGPRPSDMRPARTAFRKLGIVWEHEGTTLHIDTRPPLRVNEDLGGMIPKIDDAPWPGFPPDLMSTATVVATQVEGTVLIHEKMFESRLFFVDMLIRMGARIVLCDPHRAVISGATKLSGSELTSPDVRAGMAMVIAALCASGESTISNIYQVERGYENLVSRLTSLGADIKHSPPAVEAGPP
ncbi:MAG: UDP-N-acetylglucosamine 1-carboxyvinyltransferase [Treponema sp.]|nr:UDP-N-acetylglucosamine 1-carboxyvinyltransferase [Treponema sp.]